MQTRTEKGESTLIRMNFFRRAQKKKAKTTTVKKKLSTKRKKKLFNVNKMAKTTWGEFRRDMPYGCIIDPKTKTLQFFNRDYSYVTAAQGVWRETPDSLVKDGKFIGQEFFYGDGTKPLLNQACMDKYREELGKFLGWTELPNDKGYPTRSPEYYLDQIDEYTVGADKWI